MAGQARRRHGGRGLRSWLSTAVVLAVLVSACGAGDDQGSGEQASGDEASGEEAAGDEAAGDAQVTIAAEGLELEGTLRLPETDPPHPAVAIVHGSGPHDRDGLMPGQVGLTLPQPVAVYAELAEGLRGAGYAVLTWDKRTCGSFNDCADNDYPAPSEDLLLDTLVGDVDAVLDHLGARDDDVDDLMVVGHSKGGTIAAQLAASRDDLAAAVLLAATPLPIDEVLSAQADTLEDLVAAAGQAGGAADGAVADVRQLAEDVAEVADGEVDGPAIGGASREFWASWLEASRRSPEWLEAADAPALVLGGEQDWNVLVEQVRAWEPALSGADHLEILDGVTHALTRLEGDDPATVTPGDLGTEVEPAVVTAIVDWLDEVLAP